MQNVRLLNEMSVKKDWNAGRKNTETNLLIIDCITDDGKSVITKL